MAKTGPGCGLPKRRRREAGRGSAGLAGGAVGILPG